MFGLPDSGAGLFADPAYQQMGAMQQSQTVLGQQIASLNQQIGSLSASIAQSGVNKVTQPFMSDMSSFSNRTMGTFPALWNFYMKTNPNEMSREQQQSLATNLGTSVAQWGASSLKWGTDVMSIAAGLGGFGALGMGGAAAGLALMPMGSLYFGHAKRVMDENANMTNFFSSNAYRFMSPGQLSNTFNYNMSLPQAQSFAREVINTNQELFMPGEELDKIVKGMVGAGLMRNSGTDLKDFKKRMTETVQFIRSSAKILDETHEEIINLMADFKKLGISTSNFDVTSAKLKGVSVAVGASLQETLGTLMNVVQNQTWGTAKSPTTALQVNSDLSAAMGNIYNISSQQTKDLINQNGGSIGAASVVSNIIGNMFSGGQGLMLGGFFRPAGDRFVFDNSALAKLTSGNMTYEQLVDYGTKQMGGWTPAQQYMFNQQKGTLLSNLNSMDQMHAIDLLINSATRSPSMSGLSRESIIMTLGGTNDAGAKLMDMFLGQMESGSFEGSTNALNYQALQMSMDSGRRLLTPTWWQKMKYGVWEKFMDRAVSPALNSQNTLTNKFDQYMNNFSSITNADIWSYSPLGTQNYDFSAQGIANYGDSFNRQYLNLTESIDYSLARLGSPGLMSVGERNYAINRLATGLGDMSGIFKSSTSSSSTIVRQAKGIADELRRTHGGNIDTIMPYVQAAADATGVDVNKILAVALTETGANINASRGSSGEIGAMQLMPATAANLGVNPFDPAQNVLGGAKYLRNVIDQYGGNLGLAAIAYNAGEGSAKAIVRDAFGGRPFSDITYDEMANMDVRNFMYLFPRHIQQPDVTKGHVERTLNYYNQLGGESVSTINAISKSTEVSLSGLTEKASIAKYLMGQGIDVGQYIDVGKLEHLGKVAGGTVRTETTTPGSKEVNVTVKFSTEFSQMAGALIDALQNSGLTGDSANKFQQGYQELQNALSDKVLGKDISSISAGDLASINDIISGLESTVTGSNLADPQKRDLLSKVQSARGLLPGIWQKVGYAVGSTAAPNIGAYGKKSLGELLDMYDATSNAMGKVDYSNANSIAAADKSKTTLGNIAGAIMFKRNAALDNESLVQSYAATGFAENTDVRSAISAAIGRESAEMDRLRDELSFSSPGEYDPNLVSQLDASAGRRSVLSALLSGKMSGLSAAEMESVLPNLDAGIGMGYSSAAPALIRQAVSSKITEKNIKDSVDVRLGIMKAADVEKQVGGAIGGKQQLSDARFKSLEALVKSGGLGHSGDTLAELYSLVGDQGNALGKAQAEYLIALAGSDTSVTDEKHVALIKQRGIEKNRGTRTLDKGLINYSILSDNTISLMGFDGLDYRARMEGLQLLGAKTAGDLSTQISSTTLAVAKQLQMDSPASLEKLGAFSSALQSGKIQDFLSQNKDFEKVFKNNDALRGNLDTIQILAELNKKIAENQELFTKAEDYAKTFGKSITDTLGVVADLTSAMEKDLDTSSGDYGKNYAKLAEFKEILIDINEFMTSDEYKNLTPDEKVKTIKSKLAARLEESGISLGTDLVEGVMKGLEEKGLSNEELQKVKDAGAGIFSSTLGEYTKGQGEASAEFITGLADVLSKQKQSTQNSMTDLETAGSNVNRALTLHRQALDTFSNYIVNEINDLRENAPGAGIQPATNVTTGPTNSGTSVISTTKTYNPITNVRLWWGAR